MLHFRKWPNNYISTNVSKLKYGADAEKKEKLRKLGDIVKEHGSEIYHGKLSCYYPTLIIKSRMCH